MRPARAGDAGEVARVQVACWRCGYAGIVPGALLAELTGDQARQVWRDRWRDAITNPPTSRHRVLVAVDAVAGGPGGAVPPGRHGAVAGFASVGPATDRDRWPATDAEIYELRVAPGRTGHGHGSRLLHAVADTVADDGFRTLSAWVLEADQALLRFLESAGWSADGATGELDVGVSLPVVRLHAAVSEPA